MNAGHYQFLLLLCGVLIVLRADAGTDTQDQTVSPQVLHRYQLLARVQADKHNRIDKFKTDGCSGGLSLGWRFLAGKLPVFRHEFGSKPPYESCCVTHDRAYWRGETRDGYVKRLQADSRLRQCVIAFGKSHRLEFARKFHLSPSEIVRNFRIVAILMYRAVRVGGMPCTGLPWRWGYGWPKCGTVESHSPS